MNDLLMLAIQQQASDIHLASQLTPFIRVDGQLRKMDFPASTHDKLTQFLRQISNAQEFTSFQKNFNVDFTYQLEIYRFRVHAFQQLKGISLSFRVIPNHPPTLEELETPKVLQDFCHLSQGLILITGATGCGKSTTLAGMLNYINHKRNVHIITLEDPIEFVHTSINSLINQRQALHHFNNYKNALRAALREDPDIIVVGEMRDLATIQLALTAAETGHLVFATLHTSSAVATIDRIVDAYPTGEKNTIRVMLAESLVAIISQQLHLRPTQGRIATMEILVNSPAIRHLIRENKSSQLYSAIQMGANLGMQTYAQHFKELCQQGKIKSEASMEPYF